MIENAVTEPDWTSSFDDVLDISHAGELWRAYSEEMTAARTLTQANVAALEHLCILRVLCRRSLRACITKGTVVQPKKANAKGMERTSRHVEIVASFGRQALALEDALGLSPSARNRAGQVKRATRYEDLPAAKYLKSLQGDVVPLRRKRR